MDQIIDNQGFQQRSAEPNLAQIISRHGPGDIDHKDSAWRTHRFFNMPDADLWSAFNDIRFKNDLKGCVSKSGNALTFKGTVTWHFADRWGFSDPTMDGRQPFQFWNWLPDRYQYFQEGRFRRLEIRHWVKPFNISGTRSRKVTIKVDGPVATVQPTGQYE